jgi:hypothetical protein
MPNEELKGGIPCARVGPAVVYILCEWQQVDPIVLLHVSVNVQVDVQQLVQQAGLKLLTEV